MKPLLFFCFVILSYVGSAQGQIDTFNKYLGSESVDAFNLAVTSFDAFLTLNYTEENELDRIQHFLEDVRDSLTEKRTSWILPEGTSAISDAWENSGLRKEIYFWPNETYTVHYFLRSDSAHTIVSEEIPIFNGNDTSSAPQDSSLSFNSAGNYLFALLESKNSSPLVESYTKAKCSASLINPRLVASGLLQYKSELSTPIAKRIIIAEFYWWMIEKF